MTVFEFFVAMMLVVALGTSFAAFWCTSGYTREKYVVPPEASHDMWRAIFLGVLLLSIAIAGMLFSL